MKTGLSATLAALILVAACGEEPGRFSMSFSWDTPPEETVWVWVRIEERTDPAQAGKILASAGPEAYEVDGFTELKLGDVPNGSNRHVIVEAREGKNASLPIIYFGISNPFTISPGKTTEVGVPMFMQVPDALAVDAIVSLEFDGTAQEVVNEVCLRSATVLLESTHAKTVMLASDAGLSEDVVELELVNSEKMSCEQVEREGLTWDICRYAGWDLAVGQEEELKDQQYSVFVKFLDQYGYESHVYRASAVLDSLAPQVVLGSITPTIARPGTDVYLNVSFHEEVDTQGVTLHVEPDLPAGCSIGESQLLGSGTTCLWVITLADDWTGGNESYAFTVDTSDALGNTTDGLEVVDGQQVPLSLQIDDLPPTLVAGAEGTFSSTLFGLEHVGTLFTFSFAIEEANPQAMTQGDGGECLGLCPVVRIGNASPGAVLRNADDDLPGEDILAFTYEYEVREEDFVTKDSTPQVAISWSDKAGNGFEEVLPETLHFDFQPPHAVSCSLLPGAGNASTTFAYTVTASETLPETPELVVESETSLFQNPPEVTDGGLTYRWEQSGATLESQSFSVGVNMTDEAGNHSDGIVCSESAEVDSQIPILDKNADGLALWTVPEVIGPQGTPLLTLGDGYELHVSFPVKEDGEMAEGHPDVQLAVPGDTIAMNQLSATETEPGKWLYEYLVTISKGQHGNSSGIWPVQVTLQDAAGNQSVVGALGDELVTIDLVPPTATCKAVPLLANLTSIVTVTVTPSETLLEVPTVIETDLAFSGPEFDPLGNTYEYTHHIGIEDEEVGDWSFSVALTDLVGNVSEGDFVCQTSGTVDAKAPWMEDAQLWTEPEVVDSMGGTVLASGDDDTVFLSFVAGDGQGLETEDTSVWLDAPTNPGFELVETQEQEDGSIAYTWKLVLDEALHAAAEGNRAVALYIKDKAGNHASFNSLLGSSIRIDFTPPGADCSLLPAPGPGGYGIDNKVTLLVSPVEELSPDVALVVAESDVPGSGPFFTYEEGSAYRYSGLIGEWGETGAFGVALTLRDLVGNDTPPGTDGCEIPVSVAYDALRPEVAGGADGIEVSKSLVMDNEGFNVSFSLADGEVLDDNPVLTVGGRSMSIAGEPVNGVYDYSYVPDSQGEPPDSEGIWPLSLALEDGAGNITDYSPGTVQFDFSNPVLSGTPGVQIVAPEDCPLYSVEALGSGAGLEVTFVVSEVLDETPLVRYEGTGVGKPVKMTPVGPAEPDQLAYTFRLSKQQTVAFASDLEGTGSVVARVTDLAGNETELTVVSDIAVDTLAPASPDVATQGHIIYSRMPWGSDGTDGAKRFFLRGEAGAVEGDTTVRVYDAENISAAMFLGQTGADESGAFGALPGEEGAFKLVAVDLPQVYIEAVDTACNRSLDAGTAVAVRDVEWSATLGYKEAGSTAANPHEFLERRWFVNSLWGKTETEPEFSDALQTSDEGVAATSGASDWTLVETQWQDLPYRRAAAAAYDSWRGRLVIWGGLGDEGETNDTWEFDGVTWTEIIPEDPEGDGNPEPGEKIMDAMAFDSHRGKSVMFDGVSKETWEWDGASWARRIPLDPEGDGNPETFNGTAMVYDPVKEVAVLLAISVTGIEIWEWDGHSWNLVEKTNNGEGEPANRRDAAVAYDSQTGKIVLFGGKAVVPPAMYGDTWSWDGSQWQELTPQTPTETQPVPNSRASMAYDEERGELLLFGGSEQEIGFVEVSARLFRWTGTQWSLLEDNPGSVDPDKPRESKEVTLVYDAARQRTVLVGGNWEYSGKYNEGTFEWSGDHWVHRIADGSETSPELASPVCYSPGRQVITMHDPNEGTWEWDHSGWHLSITSPQPEDRFDFTIGCDEANDRVLLFGGGAGYGEEYNDLWEWDGVKWNELYPHGPDTPDRPPHRHMAAMAYDPSRGTMVMFGGSDRLPSPPVENYASYSDTWELDENQWTMRDFGGPEGDPEGDGNPVARMLGKLVWDPKDQVLRLLDGTYYDSEFLIPWHDHWAYDGTSWAEVSSNPPNPEQYLNDDWETWQAFTDAVLGEVVMVGACKYQDPDDPFMVWRWRNGGWSTAAIADPSGDGEPARRNRHAMTWFAPRHKAMLFGGIRYNVGDSRETWYWDNGAGERPGQVLRVSLAETGINDPSLFTGLNLHWHAGGDGTKDEIATPGARLLLWDGGTFEEVDANDSPSGGETQLTWSTTDGPLLERLPVTDALIIGAAVTPIGANWTDYATVSTSYVELILSYRL